MSHLSSGFSSPHFIRHLPRGIVVMLSSISIKRAVALLPSEIITYTRACGIASVTAMLVYPYYVSLVHWLNWSDRFTFSVLTCCLHSILYFGLNTFTLIVSKLPYFQRFQIPRKAQNTPSAELIRETVLVGFISQITAQPLTTYYIVWPVFQHFGAPASIVAPLPSFATMFWQFLVCCLFNEIFFYWSHRLLHAVPSLYRMIHKQHHQYRGSIGFAAEYAHPIEQIVSNQFPTAGGAMLFGFHPLVWLVWLTWRLLQTYESHSGLEIPLPAPFCWMAITDPHAVRWHDDHHSINTGNYGSEVLDTLFGTCIEPSQVADASASESKRSD